MIALSVVGITEMIAKTVAFEKAYRVNAKHRTKAAAERILERSQQTVHVRSGNLKATGRVEEVPSPPSGDFEFDVIYGGQMGTDRFVDYAGYEEALHPYLGPAGAAAGPDWDEAMTSAFSDSV